VAEAAPVAVQPGAPGDRLAPDASPDAVPAPVPAPDPSPTSQQGAAVVWGRATEASFAEGGWEPAARLERAGTWIGRVGEEGANVEASAGVAFALALGGTWGVATEEAEARRRRRGLRPF
jgi:hypothetical protein